MAKKQVRLRRSCGAMAAHMMLLEKFPAFRANQMRLEGATDRRRQVAFDAKAIPIVTVKTIVHVVYKTDAQNISNTQIKSQIAVLNRDFRATNPDKVNVPAPWKGIVADSRVQFKLVQVTRTKTGVAAFTHDDKVKKASTGGIASITPKTHLNIWVCALSGGCLATRSFRAGRYQRTVSSLTFKRSAPLERRKPRSTKDVRPRTRSDTISTCATSGAILRTAVVRTWWPIHRTVPARTSARQPSR